MSMQYVKHRIALERKIVGMIIADAIAQGYEVEANNDDADPIISTDPETLLSEVMATDEACLAFHKSGRCVGSVYLVYGNDGFDVIADYTDNEQTRRIVARAVNYAETAEAQEVLL